MFLKHLINPKPSIILFFIFFCALFTLFPLIQFEIDIIFSHPYLHPGIVLILALTIPFFLSIGINNMIYEKNIIRKENLVIGVVFILLSSAFINTVEAWISLFLLLLAFNFLLESYQKDLPFSQFYNASTILGALTFIYPNIICSTKEIYSKIKKFSKPAKSNIPNIQNKSNFIKTIKKEKNDLQKISVKKFSIINKVINFISIQKGCYFSRMTGSGSACFGMFKSQKTAILGLKIIKNKFPRYWCVITKTI